MCKVHFEQFDQLHACSCGWVGYQLDRRMNNTNNEQDGVYILKNMGGKKVKHVKINNFTERKEIVERGYTDPIVVRWVRGELSMQRDEADPYVYGCPSCGRQYTGKAMILDVVKKEVPIDEWPWLRKTDILELRGISAPRQMLSYSWRNWGFSIFWEMQRLLDPSYPKRKDFTAEITDEMTEKEKIKAYSAAKKAFGKAKSAHKKVKYTLDFLFKKLCKEVEHDEAVDRINALITALSLTDEDTTKPLPLLKMAFSLALERSKVVETRAVRKKYRMPDGESCLERVVDAADVKRDIDRGDDLMLDSLAEMFPGLHVRVSVSKEIAKPGIWKILTPTFRAYKKNERKEAFFKTEHPEIWYRYEDAKGKELFEYVPELNDARGDVEVMADGSGWQYWPEDGYVMIDPPGTYRNEELQKKLFTKPEDLEDQSKFDDEVQDFFDNPPEPVEDQEDDDEDVMDEDDEDSAVA